MGEFVGVAPDRLEKLTAQLKRLHEILADRGSVIQRKMEKWDAQVGFGALPRLVDTARDDARDMETRTERAYELARLKGWDPKAPVMGMPGHVPGPIPPPVVPLDWKATGRSGFQAERDATALVTAMDGENPEGKRAALREAAEKLRLHPKDNDYLRTFLQIAGPTTAQAARVLSDGDHSEGTLFSCQDQGVLTALAGALAAAGSLRTGSGKDARPLMSDATRAALTRAKDPWSVGMLLKHGPSGKNWDSRLLADITRSLLDARKAGTISFPPTRSGNGSSDLGGDVFRFQKVLADHDPVIAALNRSAENGKAARHVLGDPDRGLTYTRMLVDDSWRTPGADSFHRRPAPPGGMTDPSPKIGQVDLSSHVGTFLEAAASAKRGGGTDARESAWSVVNIAKATAEFSRLNPEKVLPAETRRALNFAIDRYLPDFAASARLGVPSEAVLSKRSANGLWVSYFSHSELKGLLKQALHDEKDLGKLLGSMDARLSGATKATVLDPSDQNYLSEMAALYGFVSKIEADRNFTEAEKKDAQNKRDATFLSMISGGFGALNFTKAVGPTTSAQVFTSLAQPPLNQALDTDHATDAMKSNAEVFYDRVLRVKIPVVQGLINAGAIDVERDASWFRDGVLTPNAEFANWYSMNAQKKVAGKELEEWVRITEADMQTQRGMTP
ncbi:hypothetical protein ACIBCT_28995 [Streptosporangium sp. NPDC050855]|uniref:hypothetical protein n=1 Tax=Streptosporangium sp. NPDC050855 TaxID=3366194 RepID=UPI00379282E1